jgi:hypothetical protein
MMQFAEEEQLTVPDLNEKVKADLGRLQKLAVAFATTQKQLGNVNRKRIVPSCHISSSS